MEAGRIGQRIRTLADLIENPSLSLSIHIRKLTSAYNSKYTVFDALFWPLWAGCINVLLRHTCSQNIHTHKVKTKSSY